MFSVAVDDKHIVSGDMMLPVGSELTVALHYAMVTREIIISKLFQPSSTSV